MSAIKNVKFIISVAGGRCDYVPLAPKCAAVGYS